MDPTRNGTDWVLGAAAVASALGVVTFAIFPLAIPFVLLTLVFTLPLALPLVVLAALAAILTGAWLAIRAAGRGIRRLSGGSRGTGVHRSRTKRTSGAAARRNWGGAATYGPGA